MALTCFARSKGAACIGSTFGGVVSIESLRVNRPLLEKKHGKQTNNVLRRADPLMAARLIMARVLDPDEENPCRRSTSQGCTRKQVLLFQQAQLPVDTAERHSLESRVGPLAHRASWCTLVDGRVMSSTRFQLCNDVLPIFFSAFVRFL